MIYKILGFIILGLFYGCYLVKMLSQLKKGIKTDRMGKGKSGIIKIIEVTMKTASYLTFAVEIVSVVMGTTLFPTSLRVTGAVIGFVGVAVFCLSVISMGDSWRAGVPDGEKTALVTEGIYKISRNPAFLGFDLVYIGIVMMFFNPVLLAVSVFTMLMFHLQIVNAEEEFLMAAFGEEYLNYKKKVFRYLGRRF